LKKALRMADPIEPPEWLTTICDGFGGSAWAEARPAIEAAAAPTINETTRRRCMSMLFPPFSDVPA
jgi:hypothetical protein